MSLVTYFMGVLESRLKAEVPIDTGNMLAHIHAFNVGTAEALITISAPMAARVGLTSRKTKVVVTGNSSSDYDYALHVNYATKSPHRFWVEHQIMEASNIVKSNQNYGLYK